MTKKIIILGDGPFAQVAFASFMTDPAVQVLGFSVERPWLKVPQLLGLPVVALEELSQHFDPLNTGFFAAINFAQDNKLRQRLMAAAQAQGFKPQGWISAQASLGPQARVGQHCFVQHGCSVDPYAEIGDNVVLWSGARVLHHARVHDHAFLGAGVIVSAFADIGHHSTLASGALVGPYVTLPPGSVLNEGERVLAATPRQV